MIYRQLIPITINRDNLQIHPSTYIQTENYRRFSIFARCPIKSPRVYLYIETDSRKRAKRRKSNRSSYGFLHRDISILSFSLSSQAARTHTPALYVLFTLVSSRERETERKHATRSCIHTPSLSIAEALSAVIGP